ncbi:MAG: hypothetical protein QW046_04460 [Candidatus Micrarchaeaceae archaeon]
MTDNLLEYDIDIIHVSCMYHLVLRQKDPQTGALLYQCPKCGRWFVFGEFKPEEQATAEQQTTQTKRRRKKKKTQEETQVQTIQTQPTESATVDTQQYEVPNINNNANTTQEDQEYLKTTEDNITSGEQNNANI